VHKAPDYHRKIKGFQMKKRKSGPQIRKKGKNQGKTGHTRQRVHNRRTEYGENGGSENIKKEKKDEKKWKKAGFPSCNGKADHV